MPGRHLNRQHRLDRLWLVTTVEERRALLRLAKDKPGGEEIRLPRAGDEVNAMVRRAMSDGALLADDVMSVVQEAEENGHQHIFYYRPTSQKAATRLADGERMAEALFGDGEWRPRYRFPRITLMPEGGPLWGDFRIGLPGRPRDWLAKLYLRDTRKVPIPESERQAWMKSVGLPEGWQCDLYRKDPDRVVTVARWNDPDVFELRVSQRLIATPATLAMRRLELQKFSRPAVPDDSIIEWDMTGVRKKMIRAMAANAAVYQTSRAKLMADGVNMDFNYGTHEENLGSSESAAGAINLILDKDGECVANTMLFKESGSGTALSRDLPVIVGARWRHEVVIRSEARRDEVDYVTDQLRRHR